MSEKKIQQRDHGTHFVDTRDWMIDREETDMLGEFQVPGARSRAQPHIQCTI